MAWVTKSSTEEYNQTPEPPREYTKREKADNWWHYHWVLVLAVAAGAALAIWFVHDTLFQTQPDLTVGYVGPYTLPDDTVSALETALTPYCEDRNGDGKVVVQVEQYTVDFSGYVAESESGSSTGEAASTASADSDSETSAASAAEDLDGVYYQMAGTTRLSAALADGDVYLFLLADPAGFEASTEALCTLDGAVPDDPDSLPDDAWRSMVYQWADCPVLAGLELGDYHYTLSEDVTGSNQEALAGLYVGRLGLTDEQALADHAADAALWDTLTAGATPLGG